MGQFANGWRMRVRRLEYLIARAIRGAEQVFGNAWVQGGNSFGATGVFGTNDANNINIRTNSTTRAVVDQAGNITPPVDATGQLGTSALRWNLVRAVTVTTGDLVMLDDDGNAHMTLKEGAEHLYLHNAKTGKTFRLLMEEVELPGDDFAKQEHGSVARARDDAPPPFVEYSPPPVELPPPEEETPFIYDDDGASDGDADSEGDEP